MSTIGFYFRFKNEEEEEEEEEEDISGIYQTLSYSLRKNCLFFLTILNRIK
jgi:hypothetical protein